MTETRMQFWHRRGRELHAMRKSELCALYRQLGGLGGSTPPKSGPRRKSSTPSRTWSGAASPTTRNSPQNSS
jgi:hypothetical protein